MNKGERLPSLPSSKTSTCVQGLDETPLTFVDTPDALHALAASLAGAREIAVDLEAHAHRSFQVRPRGMQCMRLLSQLH